MKPIKKSHNILHIFVHYVMEMYSVLCFVHRNVWTEKSFSLCKQKRNAVTGLLLLSKFLKQFIESFLEQKWSERPLLAEHSLCTLAAQEGRDDLLRCLAERNGIDNLGICDRSLSSPLTQAAGHGKVNVIQYLCEDVGMSPLERDGANRTGWIHAKKFHMCRRENDF